MAISREICFFCKKVFRIKYKDYGGLSKWAKRLNRRSSPDGGWRAWRVCKECEKPKLTVAA